VVPEHYHYLEARVGSWMLRGNCIRHRPWMRFSTFNMDYYLWKWTNCIQYIKSMPVQRIQVNNKKKKNSLQISSARQCWKLVVLEWKKLVQVYNKFPLVRYQWVPEPSMFFTKVWFGNSWDSECENRHLLRLKQNLKNRSLSKNNISRDWRAFGGFKAWFTVTWQLQWCECVIRRPALSLWRMLFGA